MSSDGTEAALAALLTQDSTTSLPHPAEADLASRMLDAAMLAGAGTGSAAETQAVMAVPAEDGGEVLVASLIEGIDAAAEAATPARTEANLDSVEYDLAPMNIVLPEDGGFVFEDLTVQSTETIVVTGTRVRHYFVPSEPPYEPPVPGDTTVLESIETPPHPDAGYHVYEIIPLGLKLRIPEAEWNALSQMQKDALFYVLNNHHKSPSFTSALQHLVNEGVHSVEVRFGTQGWNYDGTNYQFSASTLAAVSTDRLNPSGTDLAAGSKVVITFNTGHPAMSDFQMFSSTVIHELLHPFVADTQQPNGQWHDHDRVDPMTDEAWNQVYLPPDPSTRILISRSV